NSDALPDSVYLYSYELKSKNSKTIKINGIPSSVPIGDTKTKLCRSFSESLYSFSAAEKKQRLIQCFITFASHKILPPLKRDRAKPREDFMCLASLSTDGYESNNNP
ncbi:hypothetical protein MKX03_001752, partial [Papaver bracteatum]